MVQPAESPEGLNLAFRQSSARPLRVQSEQLPTESQVFEEQLLAGAKRADDPSEEMPERQYYRNYPNSGSR
jgi:hypothetical protein